MNLGEARFAGETVRLSYIQLKMEHRSKDKNQGPARHGTQAPPGQEPRDTGTKDTTTAHSVFQHETGRP